MSLVSSLIRSLVSSLLMYVSLLMFPLKALSFGPSRTILEPSWAWYPGHKDIHARTTISWHLGQGSCRSQKLCRYPTLGCLMPNYVSTRSIHTLFIHYTNYTSLDDSNCFHWLIAQIYIDRDLQQRSELQLKASKPLLFFGQRLLLLINLLSTKTPITES